MQLYPTGAGRNLPGAESIRHTAEGVREHLERSLKALNTDSIEMFYLHGPDRGTPFEETLKAVDDLHKEGKFKRFGISVSPTFVQDEFALPTSRAG